MNNEVMRDTTWYEDKLMGWPRLVIGVVYYFGLHIYVLPYSVAHFMLFLGYDKLTAASYAQAISDSFSGIILCLILWPILKDGFKRFNRRKLFTLINSVALYIPMIVIAGIVSALITQFTGIDISSNQDAINEILAVNPWAMIVPAVIVAPIIEELVFRGIIFRTLRKYGFILAALVSGLCFGLLHCFTDILDGNLMAAMFTFQYAVMGFFICYSYEKSENIVGAIILHFLNNSIALVLSIFFLG